MNSHPLSDYLALALTEEKALEGITLRKTPIADLHLPTGKLVASDCLAFFEPQPFATSFPCGTFPVTVTVAHDHNDQRIAFATIRFRDSTPVTWEMLMFEGEEAGDLVDGEISGYGVDSGTGCFLDASAAKVLARKLDKDEEFFHEILETLEKTYVPTWGWLNMPFGKGNLVAFSSGMGDGVYASYAGFDSNGLISVVVTDFSILPHGADGDHLT